MVKQDYDAMEAWREVTGLLPASPGHLLVTGDADGKPNAMTIGWAQLGVIWDRPIMTVFVRPSRYTYGLLERVGDFTVNVPSAELSDACQYCGTASGRVEDKFARPDLTAVPSRYVTSPIVDECVLHYECEVVHKNDVVPTELDPRITAHAYRSGDFHRLYFGLVRAVYGVPDLASQALAASPTPGWAAEAWDIG